MTIILRDYQREAVDAVYDAFRHRVHRPLVVMPTGSGKAPTLCVLIKELLEEKPDRRILMLVDSMELVSQNYETMKKIWPQVPMTVYMAGLKKRDIKGQVLFGSIQSLYKKAYEIERCSVAIIDESHMIPPRGDGRYRKLLGELEQINGAMGCVGFTATPFRMTSGSLVEGAGRVFDEVVYDVPLLRLIEDGWLCRLVTKGTKTVLETGGVKIRNGEFDEGELQEAVDQEGLVEAACDEIMRHGADRRCWLAFSTGVRHAHHIRDALRRRGVTVEVIEAGTAAKERARIIDDHKKGRLRCIVNDSVLTKGFDNPMIDLLAILRPTQSAGLFIQMCGRAMRTCEGKSEALVLDFGRNTMRHGPLDRIKGRAMKDKVVASSTEECDLAKECPQCATVMALEERICPECGYQFPREERQRHLHEAVADDTPLFSVGVSGWLPVSQVTYHVHRKIGSPPSLRVEYACGLMIYKEWICPEHSGSAMAKAVRWWAGRVGPTSEPFPRTAEGMVVWGRQGRYRQPVAVRVAPDGRYWKVTQVRFEEPYVPVPADLGSGVSLGGKNHMLTSSLEG